MPPTTVECPECQATLKLPATVTPGKKIRCPKCKVPFIVPDPDEDAIQSSPPRKPARPAPARDDADEDETPASRKPVRKRRHEEEEDGDDRRPLRKATRRRDEEDDEEEENEPPRKAGRKRGGVVDEEEEEDIEDRPQGKKGKKDKKKKKGSSVLLWSLIIGGAVVLLGGGITLFLVLKGKGDGSTGNQSVNTDDQLPTWKPDPKFLDQLGEEFTFEGYRIRPPKGYQLDQDDNKKDREKHGVVSCHWYFGDRLTGEAGCDILIDLGKVGQKPVGKELADWLKTRAMKEISEQYTKTTPEKGKVNGFTALRARFSGVNPKTKRKCQGVGYEIHEGQNTILLFCDDFDSKDDQRIKLLETALLTFRKP
jgi:hypothetical protein